MEEKPKIWMKLATLSGGAMLLMLIMMGAAVIHSKGDMMTERQDQLQSVVESAISVAKYYKRQADLGKISVEQAQEKTKDIVRAIRYGEHGYLFIYNTNGVTEAHAFYRELEGKYRMDLKDAKGVPYIRNQIEKAKAGGGFTFYHYKKPNRGTQVYPKMVYDKLFEPWNWVFVTGVYIDDIDRVFVARLVDWAIVILPIFLAIIVLTFVLAKTIMRPFTELQGSMNRANAATRAKTDFLANMSHEIRTPLNGAMGMMALLLGTKLSHQQKEWAKVSYKSCEDLLNLVNDILDLSKAETEKINLEAVPFDLQASVKTITEVLYPKAQRKNVEIIVAFQSDLPRYVIGDPVRMRQILTNIVNNAVKFTTEGFIMISVEGEAYGDKYNLRFEVKDTGIGIPADKQKYIFEKFTQGEESSTRNYNGTGLGLAICRKLCNLMDGDIGVRSSQGEGSTFWFTAVLGFENSTPIIGAMSPHERGEKILVDYKHKLMKKTLMGHLSGWSYHCADAEQGGGVLAMLHQDVALGQPYDFVVVDVQEQFSDTHALDDHINTIHNTSPHTHIILIVPPDSAYHYKDIQLKSSIAIVTKPIFPQEIFDAITHLVENKRDNKEPTFIGARDEKPEPESVEEKPADPDTQKLILIAEDQKVNQMLMRTVLGQFGYKTDVASNGVEAVRLTAEKQYDLIFMDGHMPEMDGLEATKQIREFEVRLQRHTPIVALTADAMKGDRDKCLAAGMDDYLHKPVKALQIKAMVEKHTENEPEQLQVQLPEPPPEEVS